MPIICDSDDPISVDVSAMSDSDVARSTDVHYVLDKVSEFRCCCIVLHARLITSPWTFSFIFLNSFAFDHPGQCNSFQLILSHNMTHKSDLPEIPWCVGSLKYLFIRLFFFFFFHRCMANLSACRCWWDCSMQYCDCWCWWRQVLVQDSPCRRRMTARRWIW